MTNQQRDAEYDVTFTGRELLCIPDPDPYPVAVRAPQRRFIGEQRHDDDLAADRSAVMACFHQRPCSRGEIRLVTGLPDDRLATALQRLQRDGVIRRIHYGLWETVQ